MRCLEIGPGAEKLPGFETLNIRPPADHVADCRKTGLPNGAFDLVYSSHCIEHVEWFEVEATIREWARLVRPGGMLEVHTVNAASLMREILEWEETGEGRAGTWKRELHRDHPLLFAAGRILNYAKKGEGGTVWMHRAILTPRYMRECFGKAGLADLEEVDEPRGPKKHRRINMGLRGRKA